MSETQLRGYLAGVGAQYQAHRSTKTRAVYYCPRHGTYLAVTRGPRGYKVERTDCGC